MSAAGNSAAAQAAALRAGARRGVLRRLMVFLGIGTAVRRADAQADRWAHGAKGEKATAALIDPLTSQGWHIRHDLALPRSRANLDHVLISPCGTAVVVVDTKAWHRGKPTGLVDGRVCCGTEGQTEDRHAQVEKVASYAQRVAMALNMPGLVVLPLIVVHGSPISGGHLAAAVDGYDGPVHVLGPEWLVSTLVASPRTLGDSYRSAALAAVVDRVLLPYVQRT